MKQEVHFTIDSEGKVEFEIKGIKGKSCEDIEKIFEEIGQKLSSEKTKDYYSKPDSASVKPTNRI